MGNVFLGRFFQPPFTELAVPFMKFPTWDCALFILRLEFIMRPHSILKQAYSFLNIATTIFGSYTRICAFSGQKSGAQRYMYLIDLIMS